MTVRGGAFWRQLDFPKLLSRVLSDVTWTLARAARVIRAGQSVGYTLDSLAVALVVRMVETTLADHRAKVQSGAALEDLLTVLDAFVEVGWPEAQALVWRVEAIFR
jgi:hypothetical protein